MKKIFLFVLLLLFVNNFSYAEEKNNLIDLKNAIITSENFVDNKTGQVGVLFDQQNVFPKEFNKNIKWSEELDKGKTWLPNWKNNFGAAGVYIDLGAWYELKNFVIADEAGVQDLHFYIGKPSNWQEISNINLNQYKTIRYLDLTNLPATRFLRITGGENQMSIGVKEIGIYGKKIKELSQEDKESLGGFPGDIENTEKLTSGQKIGANGFCDDPMSTLGVLGNLREYYSWDWAVEKNNKFNFNNKVNKDDYYKNLKENNVSTIPCVQFTTKNFLEEGEKWEDIRNNTPIRKGDNPLDPKSYSLHANFMYNFAARYGKNKNIDKNTLNVSENDELKVGLDLLKTVEVGNETNKTWSTPFDYTTPEAYAARLSADYDGHEGTIPNAGVKTADKTFSLAMAGTYEFDDNVINYLTRMKDWFYNNRSDHKFCADIINIHIAFRDTVEPEDSNYKDKIIKLKSWIDKNAPGTQIWVSEFDVHTNDLVDEDDNVIDEEKYEHKRASRLLRGYLLSESYGVDRSTMFMIRDAFWGVYKRSGLTTSKGLWEKKKSWYYVSSAVDTLKNAKLVNTSIKDNGVYIFEYKDIDNSEKIFAVWTPEGEKEVTLEVGDYEKATKVRPTFGVIEGEKEALDINNGNIKITADDTVTFVKVSNSDVEYDNYPQKIINIKTLKLGELNGTEETKIYDNTQIVDLSNGETPNTDNLMLNSFYHMFDEQTGNTTAQTPWIMIKKENYPETENESYPISSNNSYPYDAYITFDDEYTFTYVGVFDTFGVGKMDIFDANTNKLIFSSNLDGYNSWNINKTKDKISTNKIRIVKYNGAKLNELSFYGYKANEKVGHSEDENIEDDGDNQDENIEDENIKVLNIKTLKLGELNGTEETKIYDNTQIVDLSNGKKPNTDNLMLNSFYHMFDEQKDNTIPKNPFVKIEKENHPKTENESEIFYSRRSYPYDAYITFDNKYIISHIGIFDTFGVGKMDIFDANTDKLIFSSNLDSYNSWNIKELEKGIYTNKLRIVKYDDAKLNELIFYGYKK